MQLHSTSQRSLAAVRAASSLVLAASALAQKPIDLGTIAPTKSKDAASVMARAMGADHSRVYYQDASDGTWARGANYKARFANDGMELVPVIGARAPHNMPLALDLAGVTIAGDALAFTADAAPRRNGDVLEYDRGSLVERYSASPSSLEQSFVFASLPLRGELTLRVAFDGEYSARGDGRSVEFANAFGSVECANAVAIDARGRRLTLPMRLEGATYAIDVPADFVQQATLPLVVDPTLKWIVLDDTHDDDFLADAAYDATTDTWRAVYEETISASDLDVYSFAFDSTGWAVSNSAVYVDMTSERWGHARVANNHATNTFAVVCECGPIGSRTIKTRHVSAVSQSASATWTVAPINQGEVFNPDIGGDPSGAAGSNFLVVFERAFSATDHDIHARLLDSAGVPTSGVFYVDNTGSTLDEAPAISKSNGLPPASDQNWSIVWQRPTSPGDHDIFGARVHWDGSVVNWTFPVATSYLDETHPSVSSPLDLGGSARRNLMACEMRTTATDRDIEVALFTGGATYDVEDLSTLDPWSTLDQVTPRVDSDGSQFVVAFGEQFLQGYPDYDIFCAYVAAGGDDITLASTRSALAITGEVEANPFAIAAHSGGALTTQYLAAWDYDAGTDHDVLGALIDGPVGGAITTFCNGPFVPCPCGNAGAPGSGCPNSVNSQGAQLTATGTASVANDSVVLQASGMPPTASCLFFEGTGQLNGNVGLPFGDGRKCIAGSIVRFPLKGSVNGAASFPQLGDAHISVAGYLPAVGGTRYYQAWYRDPASYCGSATFNLTGAVRIDWTP